MNDLLFITSLVAFSTCELLVMLDLCMTLLLHYIDLLEFLLLLALVSIFFVHVTRLALADKLLTVVCLGLLKDLALNEVIIDHDLT